MNEDIKYYLVREKDHRDEVQMEGKRITFLSWKEDRTGDQPHRTPEVGRSLVLDFHVIKVGEVETPSYKWMTTPITEIIEEKTTPYFKILRFKTGNSNYRLLEKK